MTRKSGLADSPFFLKSSLETPDSTSQGISHTRTPQTVYPDPLNAIQTSRVPDFENYTVPALRQMERIEVRVTWDQNRYLNDLESMIARYVPEGDRSNPEYRRITKNSVIRVMIELLRTLNVQIDASRFQNERDLLKALYDGFQAHFDSLRASNSSSENTS